MGDGLGSCGIAAVCLGAAEVAIGHSEDEGNTGASTWYRVA